MVDAVFDATALILTAKIDLLKSIGKAMEISITPEVREEATAAESYDAKMIEKQVENGKITVREADETRHVLENFNLDEGEGSSIALYREINADILATDDGKAVKACKVLGVNFTTSLKLLQRAEKKDILEQERAVVKLEELEKYGWYKTRQIERTREKIQGEKS